jgi:hypothetical protein
MAEESILKTVKKLVNVAPDYDAFDLDIITYINAAFFHLYQIGVGPQDKPFTITDGTAKWSDFMQSTDTDALKSFIGLKVGLLFDPPVNSAVLSSKESLLREFEWRLNAYSETP